MPTGNFAAFFFVVCRVPEEYIISAAYDPRLQVGMHAPPILALPYYGIARYVLFVCIPACLFYTSMCSDEKSAWSEQNTTYAAASGSFALAYPDHDKSPTWHHLMLTQVTTAPCTANTGLEKRQGRD